MGTPPGRRIFGWMMFDWATQPFYTLVLTFVFGPYLAATAADLYAVQGLPDDAARAQAQAVWSRTQAIAGLAVALTAPLLGALADGSGRRAGWVAVLSVPYLAATAGLWVLAPDGDGLLAALVLFAVALIAAEFATVLTNAILPELPADGPGEMGRVSGGGFALGYAGGVLSLLLVLALLAETEEGRTLAGLSPILGLDPEAREGTRATGPFVALWYAVFMIPFFAFVRDRPTRARPSLGRALGDLRSAVAGALRRPSLRSYLLSSMLYRDALAALYAFGGTYAVLVLDWPVTQVGVFGVIGAVTAAVASWAGGRLDGRHGPRPVIAACVMILAAASLAIAATSRESVLLVPVAPGSPAPDLALYVVGSVIGGAGGALQAASRTLMARHADPGRSAEAFGLYALAGKATAFLAPALVAVVTEATGSARAGALPVAALFLLGLALLARVRPEGDAAAP
jgi:UMF1 family MFS transporter